MKVLVVDDSLKNRRAAKAQLEPLGHEVVLCSDYTKSRKLARAGEFNVILLDLLMPAEPETLGHDARVEHVGREIAIGFPLVMFMAMKGCAPRIAVVTDTNHHHHPMSAAVDWLYGSLNINGVIVRIMHAQLNADGTKDWVDALTRLLSTGA